MDPFTIMAMGSSALTAIGKLGAGFMGSQMDKLQQSIASSNQQLLVQKANLEAKEGQISLDQGSVEQARTIGSINRTLGAETGKFAASNLDPTYGSPLLLQGFSAGQGATDLALIGARAQLGNASALTQSAGTMAQAAGAAGQAAAFGMKSTQDIVSGILGAGSSLLAGGANAKMWGSLNSMASNPGGGVAGMGAGFNIMPTPGALY
jgi:hypothetical protein